MRREYDFSKGVRGKYASRLRPGSQIVVLDPDVAAAFGDAKSVNRALRALIDVVPAKPTRSARVAAPPNQQMQLTGRVSPEPPLGPASLEDAADHRFVRARA
jgi:hypothetical protein